LQHRLNGFAGNDIDRRSTSGQLFPSVDARKEKRRHGPPDGTAFSVQVLSAVAIRHETRTAFKILRPSTPVSCWKNVSPRRPIPLRQSRLRISAPDAQSPRDGWLPNPVLPAWPIGFRFHEIGNIDAPCHALFTICYTGTFQLVKGCSSGRRKRRTVRTSMSIVEIILLCVMFGTIATVLDFIRKTFDK
jgi:hypothetical protein